MIFISIHKNQFQPFTQISRLISLMLNLINQERSTGSFKYANSTPVEMTIKKYLIKLLINCCIREYIMLT